VQALAGEKRVKMLGEIDRERVETTRHVKTCAQRTVKWRNLSGPLKRQDEALKGL